MRGWRPWRAGARGQERGPQAVVVGAGPNGLAAAAVLARAGVQVRVLEAAERIGGGTRTEELTLPGLLHDVCSAVHPMGIASPCFQDLALAEHGLGWIHSPTPLAHPFDDGSAALLERSVAATVATLDPQDVLAYARLLGPFVEHWPELIGDALRPPMHLPRQPRLMARLGWYGLRSAVALMDTHWRGPRARALFAGLAGHALLPLEMAPAAIGIMLAAAGHAVGWPIARGGSRAISDALVSVLRAHDGVIELNAPVGSLDDIGPADAVLLDLTPRQVLAIAGSRLPEPYARRLARYRYGPGSFKIDWALAGPIPWRAPACARAATVHLGGSAMEIVAAARAAWEGRLPDKPFVLLAQPSLFDSTRAPPGLHTAWAYCHVPHGSTADRSEAIEAQVERFAPGFRDLVLARHTFTAAELELHNANLVGGDIAGGAESVRQLLFRPVPRLNPYATPLRGVYVCSASTPPGGGAHGMCGWHAARAALVRLR